MTIHRIVVGCDVSKANLDLFDAASGRLVRIANTRDAIAALVPGWAQTGAFVVFEATGVYDRALAQALSGAGVAHARVNPAKVRAFAKAIGRLAKTDAIDARLIASYAQALAPTQDAPTSPARDRLKIMAKRRDQLVDMRAMEKTRRSEAGDNWSREAIGRTIRHLDSEIDALEADIAAAIEVDGDLRNAARRLQSAPGIGPVAATQLIAAMPELGQLSPKRIAALAGLAPMNADSGTLRGARIIQGGRHRVRKALYMAALNAARAEGPVSRFYKRLRDAGKPAKLALIACARKLLVILNAMMRTQKDYQPAIAR